MDSMLLNIIYLAVLMAASPWLVWRRLRTGRYRHHLAAKLLGQIDGHSDERFTAWFHGVSVGEIHLLTTLVAAYRRRHPRHRIVISSTTDTGLAEAKAKFPHDTVIAWPFDFTWAAARALDAVQPSLLVLAEGEMWPNMLAAAAKRTIPVVVVNARLSPRSFGRYSRVAWLARRFCFDRVRQIAVQGDDYAERFQALGVSAARVTVTGSIKYDGAIRNAVPASWLAADAKIGPILVAGSTHHPEEEIVLDAWSSLESKHAAWSLIIVPRHPDRFDEVARRLDRRGVAFTRRSTITESRSEMPRILLLDTVGELAAAWSLATLGYVGGSLDGHRGGQSMIEPAGFGVPTVFGPHVWNFRDAARRLIDAGGAVGIPSAAELTDRLDHLMTDATTRDAMSTAARRLVLSQQGATERTLDVLDDITGQAVRHAA
jgi:3-deoxy-D-manno-octulosonic-acid transferase